MSMPRCGVLLACPARAAVMAVLCPADAELAAVGRGEMAEGNALADNVGLICAATPAFAATWTGLAAPQPARPQLTASATTHNISRELLIRRMRSPVARRRAGQLAGCQLTVTLSIVTVQLVPVLWEVTASPASREAGRFTVAVDPAMSVQV